MLARKLGKREWIGWLSFGLALAAAFATLGLGGPGWAVDALLGLCFLLAMPLMLLAIRGHWRRG
jgi:hypothetical protein